MAARTGTVPAVRRGVGFDPFRFTWALLTNVKFALLLVGLGTAAAFVGVVVPQVPIPMRSNAAARSAWLEMQRGRFGNFTEPMDRLQVFEVFYSPWFNGLWVVVIVAVTVCTVSRLRPTARSVHHPPRQVPDRYFETAHHRASFSYQGDADAVAAELRRRRYRVERTHETAGGVYLFAQRYQWSQYGTFISHLALLLLLVGGVLTRFLSFDRTMIIAEGQAPAVFSQPGPNQLFVKVVDSYRGLDANGIIIDDHADLEVTRGGQTIVCTTTVNTPCPAFGYNVHLASFFNDFGKFRVTGPNGRVEYDGLMDFRNQTTVVPQFRVTRGGQVLFEGPLPQFGTDDGGTAARGDDRALAPLLLPGPQGVQPYGVSWRVTNGGLNVTLDTPSGRSILLRQGNNPVDGISFDLLGGRKIPAIRYDDVPGAGPGGAILQLVPRKGDQPYLVLAGVDDVPATLMPGESYTSSMGYTYTYGGPVEASGLQIRRDPGDTFIWIAVIMAMVGLAVTFYVPRRRVWVKVTPGRAYFAGIAERTTRLGREFRLVGVALGSGEPPPPDDRDEAW